MGTSYVLNEAYLKESGLVTLEPGEEIRELTPMGEYYDKVSKVSKKCNLVFTSKRFYVIVETSARGGLFHKKTLPFKVLGSFQYEQFESLNQYRVGGDDTFCRIVLKNGDDIAINIFGDFFGPLAMRINSYSGLNIPKKRL